MFLALSELWAWLTPKRQQKLYYRGPERIRGGVTGGVFARLIKKSIKPHWSGMVWDIGIMDG